MVLRSKQAKVLSQVQPGLAKLLERRELLPAIGLAV